MASVTLTLPDNTIESVERYPWVNWSEVGKAYFSRKWRRMNAVERLNELTKGSKLTEEMALKLAEESKETMFRR